MENIIDFITEGWKKMLGKQDDGEIMSPKDMPNFYPDETTQDKIIADAFIEGFDDWAEEHGATMDENGNWSV